MEDATSKPHTVIPVDMEARSKLIPVLDPKGFSNEDENVFSGLSPEVIEVLDFLLQTISTVEGEILQDDEGAENQHDNRACANTQQSTPREASTAKPVSKVKMLASLSEESISLRRGLDPCSRAQRAPILGSSHPTHFRKFDTIARSGVNVQELRSQFLRQLDSSAEVKKPTEAAAGTIKQPGLLFGGQKKSPRDEALRKLGLLIRNASFPNANGPLGNRSGQCAQMPLAEGLTEEATLNSINASGEPVERQMVATTQEKVLLPQELKVHRN